MEILLSFCLVSLLKLIVTVFVLWNIDPLFSLCSFLSALLMNWDSLKKQHQYWVIVILLIYIKNEIILLCWLDLVSSIWS